MGFKFARAKNVITPCSLTWCACSLPLHRAMSKQQALSGSDFLEWEFRTIQKGREEPGNTTKGKTAISRRLRTVPHELSGWSWMYLAVGKPGNGVSTLSLPSGQPQTCNIWGWNHSSHGRSIPSRPGCSSVLFPVFVFATLFLFPNMWFICVHMYWTLWTLNIARCVTFSHKRPWQSSRSWWSFRSQSVCKLSVSSDHFCSDVLRCGLDMFRPWVPSA